MGNCFSCTTSTETDSVYSSKSPNPVVGGASNNSFLSNSSGDVQLSASPQGPLTREDINARIVCSKEPEQVEFDDFKITYAYASQRGYYPDAPKKANQDAFCCIPNFNNDKNQAFFGVFDGHGVTGDACANFAQKQLPKNLSKILQKDPGNISGCLTQAHNLTNSQLRVSPIDDLMSGTTSISILFTDKEMHISNVGDSRAVIAQDNVDTSDNGGQSRLQAKALSIDQTPFRYDERERVKKYGARIMTIDQLDGFEPLHEDWGVRLGEEIDEKGDPPRIWHPDGAYPGTAFTRSIGDSVSERLGVYSEPEILSKTLNKHDRFIVIASDGVFEFLTSQAVINIVDEYDNPLKACKAVVEEAYNQWIQFEPRTDDITIICLFFEGMATERDHSRSSIFSGEEILKMTDMQRPVRGHGFSQKRDTIISTEGVRLSLTTALSTGGDSEYNIDDHVVFKSDIDIEAIKSVVKHNFLFNQLSPEKLNDIISVMKKKEVKAGEIIIRQLETGDKFYLIDRGSFEVRIRQTHCIDSNSSNDHDVIEASDDPDAHGEVVHVYTSSDKIPIHPAFGDLALIYSKPRAATIIAQTSGCLWELDRSSYRSILMRKPMRVANQTLRDVKLLRPLSYAQLQLLAEMMTEKIYAEGEIISKIGNRSNTFYIILDGEVGCFSQQSEREAISSLGNGEYFGEETLLRVDYRPFTYKCLKETTVLYVCRDTFESSLGRLSLLVQKDWQIRTMKEKMKKLRQDSDSTKKFLDFSLVDSQNNVNISTDMLITKSILSNDKSNMLRIVAVKDSNPLKLMTLRTFCKSEFISKPKFQDHLIGEMEIYYTLIDNTSCKGIPQFNSINYGESNIHLLYDEVAIGTLDSFLQSNPQPESVVKYYTAQIVLSLEFLHMNGIISRCIDPLHLLVNRFGNLVQLDFRISKYTGTGRTFTFCGNPQYLAPEQISGLGHNLLSDYWSLGIVIYTLLTGHTPFHKDADSDLDIFNSIANFDTSNLELPDNASSTTRGLLLTLLDPRPNHRLGFQNSYDLGNYSQIRGHPFFAGISWQAMKECSIPAPFEIQATKSFNDLFVMQSSSDIDIGDKYEGNETWLEGF